MTISEVIQKAIEGGWYGGKNMPHTEKQKKHILIITDGLSNIDAFIMWQEAFLDPSFWQSLGKAMGWEDIISHKPIKSYTALNADMIKRTPGETILAEKITGWLYHWHRFVDSLADGKTAEQFFAELPPKSGGEESK